MDFNNINFEKFLFHMKNKDNNSEKNIIKKFSKDFIVNELIEIKNHSLDAKEVFENNSILNENLKEGKYQLYVLKKENCSMSKAISKLMNFTNKKESKVNYSGIKDKKAITYQFITIENGPKKNLDSDDISLKFVCNIEKPIYIGQNTGNNFQITIRNYESNNLLPQEKEIKFANFFGEQRFSKNNFDIGLNFLKKDFKTACYLILQNFANKNIEEEFNNKEYEKIEISSFEERKVLEHLQKNENDYIGAIKKIKLKFLKLYLASVQSAIFNEIVAKYVQKNLPNDTLIPLYGFGIDLDEYAQEVVEILEKILDKYSLKKRDFIIRNIPELSLEGESRKMFEVANINSINEIKTEKTMIIDFNLNKGTYATVFLAHFFS